MMSPFNEKGLTLVELLVTITILGIIAGAAIPLLSASLDANKQGTSRSQLYHEGLLAMERMTSGVKRCTFLLIPNAHKPTRDILAFSGLTNEDDDYYFNDPLFPKIDEDPRGEMSQDDAPGILGVDDDGDGLVDEELSTEHGDDDEDYALEEDPLNGEDDDGDGNIDEDTGHDSNDDGAPGIAEMDDNSDGVVDNGYTAADDDEDGERNEDNINPVMYTFDSFANTLREQSTYQGTTTILSTQVTNFEATYQSPTAIKLKLQLKGDDGKTIEFVEYVCPRNTLQKTGKRVR
jgi:prepilin-type N-terminal cleavage/methylation domain-containing protein